MEKFQPIPKEEELMKNYMMIIEILTEGAAKRQDYNPGTIRQMKVIKQIKGISNRKTSKEGAAMRIQVNKI